MNLKLYTSCILLIVNSTGLFGQTNRDAVVKEFAAAKDDSAFIAKHSARPYQQHSITRTIGYAISESPFDSLIFYHGKKAKVIGPLNFNEQIIYIKISDVDSAWRMRVGNIWLSPEKRGQQNIDSIAVEILETVTRTGDFHAMTKYSDEAINQAYEADLGWVYQGVFVEEFEKEVLKHKKGDVYVVSTRFGKHVVKTIDTPVFDRSKVKYVLLVFDKK